MKTVVIAGPFAAVILVGLAGLAWAEIAGSKHDFSNKDWSGGDACGACHSPHRSVPPDAAPLWDPDADLSRTFGATIGGDTPSPGSGTMICVRCHDGTLAPETITGVKGDRFKNKHHPGFFGAGHDTSDHPVGIAYPQFDKGFQPMSSVLASGQVRLPNGRVECVSCHDPHNQAGEEKMLVRNNARSALCLTCHKK